MSDINQEHGALVFVPRSANGGFACFMDLEAGRPKVYAFTSRKKAKTFLRVMRKDGFFTEFDRIQPCTLSEWRECQQQKNDLHDLAIDQDPHGMAKRSLDIAFDPQKENLRCITTGQPNGTPLHRLEISPRDEQAS